MSHAPGWLNRWVAEWEADHRNPINRALHFFVGMPLVGIALLSLICRYWPGLYAFPAGYAVMFCGHFVFERNLPTVLRDPRGVLGAAGYVIERLIARPLRRVFGPPRVADVDTDRCAQPPTTTPSSAAN